MIKKRKKAGQAILLYFIFLLLPVPIDAAGEQDVLPEEEAIEAARYIMMGMIGYAEQETLDFRYEAFIPEESSIATTVKVYPEQGTDQAFTLQFYSDGSMIESNFSVPEGGFTIEERIISSNEAVEMAHKLLMGLYGFSEEVVNGFCYETVEKEDIGLILVRVYPFGDMDDHYSIEYWLDGRLMSMTKPEILNFNAYVETVRETGRPFQWFTHEERAEYSKTYIPKVEAALRLNPQNKEALYHFPFTRHVYGVPDEQDIAEEQALEIGRKALMERLSCSEAGARSASFVVYLDCCDADQKLWEFYFSYAEDAGFKRAIVQIDAHTGEIVNAYALDHESLDERY